MLVTVDALQAATTRAQARERMFALLSHELRTPLNGVLGMAGLLAATPLDATQSAYLGSLRDCAEHLLGLVNDVLDLAKLEAGRIELEPAPTDVEHLLQGVCELLSPRAHASGVEIGWWVGADVPVLQADDGRLRQILFNLAGNAVKLTREGGVEVSATRVEGSAPDRVRIAFMVADTGPGLQPGDRQRIFQDFVQAPAGEAAGGAGLGLAIVKRLADAFEGEVSVESTPGEGARFRFEADFAIAAAPPVPPGELAGVRVRIETPSPVLRAIATGQLHACGARPCTAGEAADVVLVDAGPGADPAAPTDAPALVLLTPEARERIAPLRSAGFAGYLIKPLRRSSVAARIQAVLQAPAAQRALARGADGGPGAAEGDAIPGDELHGDERVRTTAPAAGAQVLLAEDNAVNALLARVLLERRGCRVDRAGGGEEALAAARARTYDLILMDMRMPGMDGLEATRALRAQGVEAPIVALTANAFDEDRRACLAAGMDGFLSKPLDPAALDAVLDGLALSGASPPGG